MSNEIADKAAWTHYRTCSRVSGGPCHVCRKETFFGYWVRGGSRREVRCGRCWELQYEPEKVKAEDEARVKVQAEEDALRADERERRKRGDPPPDGWERTPGGLLIEKIKDPVPGAIYARRIVEVEPMLFDTETYKQNVEAMKQDAKAPEITLFSNFAAFSKNPRPGGDK